MKFVVFLYFYFVPFFCCYSQIDNHEYLKIENIRLQYGRERLQFYKIFDSNNKLLIYKEGNVNTTDSIVYKYDANGNLVGFDEFLPNNEGISVRTHHEQKSLVDANYSFCILDTFNLFEDISCNEIDVNYKSTLKIDSFPSDSGTVFKYYYPVGEKPFLVLPFSSNNRGKDISERLDSLILLIHNKKLYQEEYYFETYNVIRKFFYMNDRLVSMLIEPIYFDGKIDESEKIEEIYRYTYFKYLPTEPNILK